MSRSVAFIYESPPHPLYSVFGWIKKRLCLVGGLSSTLISLFPHYPSLLNPICNPPLPWSLFFLVIPLSWPLSTTPQSAPPFPTVRSADKSNHWRPDQRLTTSQRVSHLHPANPRRPSINPDYQWSSSLTTTTDCHQIPPLNGSDPPKPCGLIRILLKPKFQLSCPITSPLAPSLVGSLHRTIININFATKHSRKVPNMVARRMLGKNLSFYWWCSFNQSHI